MVRLLVDTPDSGFMTGETARGFTTGDRCADLPSVLLTAQICVSASALSRACARVNRYTVYNSILLLVFTSFLFLEAERIQTIQNIVSVFL